MLHVKYLLLWQMTILINYDLIIGIVLCLHRFSSNVPMSAKFFSLILTYENNYYVFLHISYHFYFQYFCAISIKIRKIIQFIIFVCSSSFSACWPMKNHCFHHETFPHFSIIFLVKNLVFFLKIFSTSWAITSTYRNIEHIPNARFLFILLTKISFITCPSAL